jgi:hypothetical protein
MEHRTTEERWRNQLILRIKKQETRLILHEHNNNDDDDDDDDDDEKPPITGRFIWSLCKDNLT